MDRDEQPYVAIAGSVTMTTFGAVADRLPEVLGWLAEREIAPAGAPFFRYIVIDMANQLDIEVGVPVATAQQGAGDVVAGVLSAGRYATVRHVGHPDELLDVTGDLLAWGEAKGLTWDKTPVGAGERWGCRLEILYTDPTTEPDMNKWETELVFRLTS